MRTSIAPNFPLLLFTFVELFLLVQSSFVLLGIQISEKYAHNVNDTLQFLVGSHLQ